MLTQEDLQSITSLFENQNQHLERLEQKMDSGFGRLEQRMDGLEQRMDGLEQRMDGLEQRMDGLEQRMDGLEQRMDGLEQRVDGLEQRMDRMEGYMHKKFALMENELIPKVNALYEATDLYVMKMEYRKRNEEVEGKLEYIAPLVEVTQSHSRKLERYDVIFKELATVM